MNKEQLQTVLYKREEIAGEKALELLQKNSRLTWIAIEKNGNDNIKEILVDRNCLLIAAKDQTVRLAKDWDLAVIGYTNPNFPNQRLERVDLIAEGFDEIDDEYLNRIWQRHHQIPWEIARTKRCIIRELSLSDMKDLFQLYEQPGFATYMESLYPWEEELEYERAYIANMYRFYEYGMWLVFDVHTGELIGRAGLEHRVYEDDTFELEMGYAITPNRWHQGYATEVCRAIMEYAKNNLAFERINCLVDQENVYSIALLEKLGFHFLETTSISGETMQRYVLELTKYCFFNGNKI